ncbi:MAG: hypothetical protein AABZ47_10645 [Planctomycetota bacterium]
MIRYGLRIELLVATGLFALALFLVGCEQISVSPSCPTGLRVGQSRNVRANQRNPGEIARYLWEVIPSDAGRFTSATDADTDFTALREGEVTLRLTASDGLYQVMAECPVRITGIVGLAVILEAEPVAPRVGQAVRLTCSSIGSTEAVRRMILLTDGDLVVDLNTVSEGVVRFAADDNGELVFRCIGEGEDGTESAPTFLTVVVGTGSPDDNANVNINANDNNNNANQNTNLNADSTDVMTDNDNQSPPPASNDNRGGGK